MKTIAEMLGGKQYIVWVLSFVGALVGKIDFVLFHQLTLAYLLTQAVESGIQKKETDEPTKIWVVLGGRKLTAWMATSALLLFREFPGDLWLQVSIAYAGSEMLETATFAGTNGLEKIVASKTRIRELVAAGEAETVKP